MTAPAIGPITLPHARRAERAGTCALLSDLREVAAVTDEPCTLARAARLTRRVRFYDRYGNVGMLGRNGVAPEVADTLRAARFHGFDWRTRGLVS